MIHIYRLLYSSHPDGAQCRDNDLADICPREMALSHRRNADGHILDPLPVSVRTKNTTTGFTIRIVLKLQLLHFS